MQCYVRSAGRGYDQDYTWLQIFGKDDDCTDLLRKMTGVLSQRVPAMAVFCQDGKYYLLVGGLKTERTDIVGTPIYNTFVFVSSVEEEQNIRFLVAGILSSNIKFKQHLFSSIQEDINNKSGFCASDNFGSTIETWLKEEGAGVLKSLENDTKLSESKLASFLQNALPVFEQNILLVNSDREGNSKFCIHSACEINWESITNKEIHPEILKYDAGQQSQNNEVTMNIQTPINTPLKDVDETDSFKIFLRTASRRAADYHFWNNSEPEWAENIKKKLFPIEIPMPKINFYIAIEQATDSYHIYLQDEMQIIKDEIAGARREIRVALLFEVPVKIKERTQENIECGIRSICASWTDLDPDYGNKVLREIIERKAVVIGEDSFEVNEGEMKKILWDFFNKGNSLESNPCHQEVCHIAKDWQGLEEAKRWFGEKLHTTSLSYDNSLLCYFTPCEVADPEKVSYCARWSHESETVIPKANVPDKNIVEGETTSAETSNQQKVNSANEPRTTTGQTSTTSSTCNTARQSPRTQPVHRKKKQNNYLFIGIIILISLLIVMIKSCSGSAGPKKEESLSPTKVEQSSAREGKGSKINKKSSSSQNNNKQK